MKKHQKYHQADMYRAIENCDKQNMSYPAYCRQARIPYASFKYWVSKYKLEKAISPKETQQAFLPVEFSVQPTLENSENKPREDVAIQIHYPNGISLNCPRTIGIDYLKVLLKF
jgi:hypothetical protein